MQGLIFASAIVMISEIGKFVSDINLGSAWVIHPMRKFVKNNWTSSQQDLFSIAISFYRIVIVKPENAK